MKTFSLVDVAIMEANAIASGVSIDTLMDRAGKAVAEEAARHLPPPPAKVGIVCGGGNNGGDGLAAAFYLKSKGFSPEVWLLHPPHEIRSRPARRRWEFVSDVPGIHIHTGIPTVRALQEVTLVIDAMIGTGGHGALRDPYKGAVDAIRQSGVPVLSVDLPTGLGTDSPVPAMWTVSIEVMKEGMESGTAGEVTVRSIGFPPEALEETGVGEFLLFPRPGRGTVKGESGRLVIVGGGPYTGAPALAALSALSSGCDMVFVIAPEPAATVIRGYSPNLIVRSVGEDGAFTQYDADELEAVVSELHPSAVLIGNGAGHSHGTINALDQLARHAVEHAPVVLDADATRLAAEKEVRPLYGKFTDRLLLTPNRRELYRILGHELAGPRAQQQDELARLSRALGATLLVKGEVDLVTDGSDSRENRTHHPSMVVGGAGDVLSGLAASLMARGLTALQAGRLASYWLGLVSLDLFDKMSYGVTATDLIHGLPASLDLGLKRVREQGGP